MLVLSRKINERILIGDSIEIKVLKVSNGRVKIGIDADAFIDIRRGELELEIEETGGVTQAKAASVSKDRVSQSIPA
ncbi:carbon storage regulator [Rubinisphaera margarita]|uniref:carbon storage regulator n=1 Tax=Rubinisphaera margarita TaxID=2909586 RepID=UPI001EE88A7C|nr:carbon storage regulator [Rubinisphaera margarita]MCG6156614.1 carbon storage regulator [Rubinisphaera margarita]